jgi:hypothetical protein
VEEVKMEKICKNCKYFNQDEDDKEIGYGTCACEKMIYDCACCFEPKEKDLLFYMDYEGYNASIEVGEEFGCIHFIKKSKQFRRKNDK